MPVTEVEQIELLNREHRELTQRLASGDYHDEEEKHLLEEILEENLWSLKVLATSKEVRFEVNPFDIVKEVVDESINNAFLYCIMEKTPIQKAAKIIRDLSLPERTGKRKNLQGIVESLETHECPCSLNFCKGKPDSKDCLKGVISILKQSLAFEKYVWMRHQYGMKEFSLVFHNSFNWLMGYQVNPLGLRVDTCFDFLDRDLSNVRRAFRKLVNVTADEAIDFFQKFTAMPTLKPMVAQEVSDDYSVE